MGKEGRIPETAREARTAPVPSGHRQGAGWSLRPRQCAQSGAGTVQDLQRTWGMEGWEEASKQGRQLLPPQALRSPGARSAHTGVVEGWVVSLRAGEGHGRWSCPPARLRPSVGLSCRPPAFKLHPPACHLCGVAACVPNSGCSPMVRVICLRGSLSVLLFVIKRNLGRKPELAREGAEVG